MSISLSNQQQEEILRPANCLSLPFFNHNNDHHRRKTPSSFLELTKERRFHDILQLLPKVSDSWLVVRRSDGTLSTCETLHALVMHKPNATIVHALLERLHTNPRVQPLLAVDAHGRTPLHIAVAKGCDYDVVELLMSPSAITTRDNEGRYPLHWACIHASASTSSRTTTTSRLLLGGNRKAIQKSLRVVSALVEDYPEAVTVCDFRGETPLDLAKRRGAHPRILEQIQLSWKSKMKQQHPSTSATPECSWEEDVTGFDVPLEVRRIFDSPDWYDDPCKDEEDNNDDMEHHRCHHEEYDCDDDVSSMGYPSFSRDQQDSEKKHHHRSKSKYPHEVVEF